MAYRLRRPLVLVSYRSSCKTTQNEATYTHISVSHLLRTVHVSYLRADTEQSGPSDQQWQRALSALFRWTDTILPIQSFLHRPEASSERLNQPWGSWKFCNLYHPVSCRRSDLVLHRSALSLPTQSWSWPSRAIHLQSKRSKCRHQIRLRRVYLQ